MDQWMRELEESWGSEGQEDSSRLSLIACYLGPIAETLAYEPKMLWGVSIPTFLVCDARKHINYQLISKTLNENLQNEFYQIKFNNLGNIKSLKSIHYVRLNRPNRVDFGQGDSGDDRTVLGKVQGVLGMPLVWHGLKHASPANNTRPSLAKRKANFAMGYARQRHGLPWPGQPYCVA
ncbi:hypothetical protein Scep_004556 [Stephania cephalantha]|uniref:Uncharacterized protein n=1 Tax=Stephania cephalantha TaxID=152367 RepID=A0AAP0KUF5_9MAGN